MGDGGGGYGYWAAGSTPLPRPLEPNGRVSSAGLRLRESHGVAGEGAGEGRGHVVQRGLQRHDLLAHVRRDHLSSAHVEATAFAVSERGPAHGRRAQPAQGQGGRAAGSTFDWANTRARCVRVCVCAYLCACARACVVGAHTHGARGAHRVVLGVHDALLERVTIATRGAHDERQACHRQPELKKHLHIHCLSHSFDCIVTHRRRLHNPCVQPASTRARTRPPPTSTCEGVPARGPHRV